MEMTFIYESGQQQRAKLHHSHRQWRNAEPMRLGASTPTGSEPRPRLEHKMGGLHLPGAPRVWDEACVNWALGTASLYPVIEEALWLAGSERKRLPVGGRGGAGALLKVEPEHQPLRFSSGSTAHGCFHFSLKA